MASPPSQSPKSTWTWRCRCVSTHLYVDFCWPVIDYGVHRTYTIHIDYMAMTTTMATLTAIDMPKSVSVCVRSSFFFFSFCLTHRLISVVDKMVSNSHPVRACARAACFYVHFSLYDISTWHNAIFDEYFYVMSLTISTNIQNYNDKMQHQ